MFYYSANLWFVLIALIMTGAMRTVAVKILFQMDLEAPFFVTILFHIAGLPAFAFHYLYLYCWSDRCHQANRHPPPVDNGLDPIREGSGRYIAAL